MSSSMSIMFYVAAILFVNIVAKHDDFFIFSYSQNWYAAEL